MLSTGAGWRPDFMEFMRWYGFHDAFVISGGLSIDKLIHPDSVSSRLLLNGLNLLLSSLCVQVLYILNSNEIKGNRQLSPPKSVFLILWVYENQMGKDTLKC